VENSDVPIVCCSSFALSVTAISIRVRSFAPNCDGAVFDRVFQIFFSSFVIHFGALPRFPTGPDALSRASIRPLLWTADSGEIPANGVFGGPGIVLFYPEGTCK
jgi:hypothetical protein